jgi:hypothetical protein
MEITRAEMVRIEQIIRQNKQTVDLCTISKQICDSCLDKNDAQLFPNASLNNKIIFIY